MVERSGPGPRRSGRQATTLGWARVKPPGTHMLRRGAWYPVVVDNRYPLVVLGVPHRHIAVPRDSLQFQRRQPVRFSVVVRSPEEPNPVQGTWRDMGPTYAVCPACRTRLHLDGRPKALRCEHCGYGGSVAWDSTC